MYRPGYIGQVTQARLRWPGYIGQVTWPGYIGQVHWLGYIGHGYLGQVQVLLDNMLLQGTSHKDPMQHIQLPCAFHSRKLLEENDAC